MILGAGAGRANALPQAFIARNDVTARMLQGGSFVSLPRCVSLFTQTSLDLIKGQQTLASAIVDRAVLTDLDQANRVRPAHPNTDLRGKDACVQATFAAPFGNGPQAAR